VAPAIFYQSKEAISKWSLIRSGVSAYPDIGGRDRALQRGTRRDGGRDIEGDDVQLEGQVVVDSDIARRNTSAFL
jgi:hypothetical protein